jgi:stearoyl-CoA desaturase (delta-9 desaturase)
MSDVVDRDDHRAGRAVRGRLKRRAVALPAFGARLKPNHLEAPSPKFRPTRDHAVTASMRDASTVKLMYLALCVAAFLLTYGFTIVTTSVGYHRGLAHGAVKLREPWRRLLVVTGIWLTGVDPKAWVVMHRLHHAHSDTDEDPHTPSGRRKGVLGFASMFVRQLVGYNRILDRIRAGDETVTSIGKDLELSWCMRTWGAGWLPLLLHVGIALGIVALGGGWLLAGAVFAGMMSHIVQGAIINYFGHAYGGRNFDSDDDSRNNHFAGWLVLGEGFQNNHHRYAKSARFSYLGHELDIGFGACLVLEKLGVLDIDRATLIPRERTALATRVNVT